MDVERPEQDMEVVDTDMVSFFDLLARFDYEDRQKDSRDSIPALLPVPGESGLEPEVLTSD